MVKNKILEITVCGGSLALDFVNTVGSWTPTVGNEYLTEYQDFQVWTKMLDVLKPTEYKRYSTYLTETKINEQKTMLLIRDVRQNLYECFQEIASGKTLRTSSLEAFNQYMHRCNDAMIYVRQKDGSVAASFNDEQMEFLPLWYVLKDAEQLLLHHASWSRIGECPSCGWLFLDSSKGGRRKWCDMAMCGSRDKALRYYRRTRRA